jgi:serine/threonine protein kinase
LAEYREIEMVGKTLAHYEIIEQLGKGGMGEVYQAKDTKLVRDVAVKVLPEEFARDTDRVARFQREAKLLASLNHPNIAAIYGLEESGDTHFLVLELVEGDTLADRLKHGFIPVEEALKLALQMAEALEAAHEKGVIHRDLKPANIKVTSDGKVKILDFGLAKVFTGDQGEVNLADSPTISVAATQKGVILGTAAYMSPEQARGEMVDKKADIWAFGVVLFEMLTGRQVFTGRTVSDTLASVLAREPEWNGLPPNLHFRIRLLLERCLQKESKNRYHDIADARIDIQEALVDPEKTLSQALEVKENRGRLVTIFPWAAATLILGLFIAGMGVWKLREPKPNDTMRFEYHLPDDQQYNPNALLYLAVSPDGKKIAYSTDEGIYLRPINEFRASLIFGTNENPHLPFFSPDGQWIGYFSISDNQLKKVSISGGAPKPIADCNWVAGAMWNPDETIVYGDLNRGIMKVSAQGGTPEVLIEAESEECILPQMLPNGKTVLFTHYDDRGITTITVQSLESGERKLLFDGLDAHYLPTGHIIYYSDNKLFAVPFNLDTLEVTGTAAPIIENAMRYAVSDSGVMIYIPDYVATLINRSLVWVDRDGNEKPLMVQPAEYIDCRISPDGSRVALTMGTAGMNEDIWILDLASEIPTRFTFNESMDNTPLWTPDGNRIVFWSNRQEGGIYWKSSDNTGNVEKLGPISGRWIFPSGWSEDGKIMVLEMGSEDSGGKDIIAMSMEGDHPTKKLLSKGHLETNPRISADGQWMAYTSNESGQNEIYVRPFPLVEAGIWQVSIGGGHSPLWAPDGRELFYRSGVAVMAVPIETEPTFKIRGRPEELFRDKYFLNTFGYSWDISHDGNMFLMVQRLTIRSSESKSEIPPKMAIVTNWFEELKQKVPKD